MRLCHTVSLLLMVLAGLFSTGMARDHRGTTVPKSEFFQRQAESDSVPPNMINWPLFHGIQRTGEINATFDCFGNFGMGFAPAPFDFPGASPVSFVTPPNSGVEYLFGGAVWIGGIVGNDTLVSVGSDGWRLVTELFPRGYGTSSYQGTVTQVDYVSDFSMRAEFNDTYDTINAGFNIEHIPLNVNIANRSHAWHTEPLNNTVIYDIVMTNIGNDTIENGFIGMYIDGDVGNNPSSSFVDDLSGSFREKGIGYIIDDNGELHDTLNPATRIIAGKFISNSFGASDSVFAWWMSNSDTLLDFGPRHRGTAEDPFRDFGTGGTGTPMGDENKYYIMSFNEWDYDQILTGTIGNNDSLWALPSSGRRIALGGDARFLLSLGPFHLKPDSSIRVLYAMFTGDSVHVNPDAVHNLPDSPQVYYSQLDFTDVLENADVSDSLGQILLDPNLPPLGLQIVTGILGEPELRWDPWVYDVVGGYHLFISPVDMTMLPYPGAIPPWWQASTIGPPISIPPTHRFSINYLNPNTYYLAQIANRFNGTRGELSAPLIIRLSGRNPAPLIPSNYALTTVTEPITLKWSLSGQSAIDHINIYKFSDSAEATKAYHAFYDEGYSTQFIQPRDSIRMSGRTYYYYAMLPYAVVQANDTEFVDQNFVEGEAYVIAAADEYDIESEFTDPIIAYIVPEKNRELLLLTNSMVFFTIRNTKTDSILSFYDKVLEGFDYEIYSFVDSFTFSECPDADITCFDWRELLRYETLIVDDRLSELMLDTPSGRLDAFSRFIAYGGRLVFFGRLSISSLGLPILNGIPEYKTTSDNFADLFGFSSSFFSGRSYYVQNSSPPYIDSLFGFTGARQSDGSLPSLDLDVTRDPFYATLRERWPMVTPPGVASFIPTTGVQPTHVFESNYPLTSVQQGHIVGLRKDWPGLNTQTYTFGFHLWYMDTADARELFETIIFETPFALAAKTVISPDLYYIYEADPAGPTNTSVYIGNLELNHDVTDIDITSLRVNGTVSPVATETLPSHPDFEGQVLRLDVPLEQFLQTYGALWDTLLFNYYATGSFIAGRTIRATGTVTIVGRLRGDLNGDQLINVVDLTILIDFIYRGGLLPEESEAADIDGNGSIDVLDMTQLIDHVFRGIPIGNS